jgi:quinol monooxygenase YgiN
VLSSLLLLLSALLASSLPQQAGAGVVTDTNDAASAFYAVSYVESAAMSATKAAALLKQYRDTSARQDGYLGVEFFEQIGRPGHFVLIEGWRGQKEFDARDAAPQKQLMSGLEPLRVSGYDQRPYKALTVNNSPPVPQATARPSRDVVYVISHVDVTPNPQVPVMLRQLAEVSRKETGNVRFDVYQHTMRANHFTVVEVWRDQKALDAHVASPHARQYRDTLQPMTGSPLDERVYRAID